MIKRRQFLQFAGSTLAALGLSQWDLSQQGDRLGQVLAQGTRGRKLALLVGINAYPTGISDLRGCLTDVELQRELLVHRYGFNPQDILIVSDAETLKPNRQTILEAFEHHLIKQAKPGDVVMFHYSGHGSLVHDPDPIPTLMINGEIRPNVQKLNGTLVPSDRTTSDPGIVQDIMGRTLFLLMRSLPTDLVTVVLDSCHSGGGTRGGLTFRATPSRLDGTKFAHPSPVELELQQRLMKTLNITETDFNRWRQQGIAKGVAIGSAQFDQYAADASFDNAQFHAGAFTYLLTRYLWQATGRESIGTAFVNLSRSTQDLSNQSAVTQVPIFAANPASNGNKPAYFIAPPRPWAEAVIRQVKSAEQIEYWLGGVSSLSLAASDQGGLWAVLDAEGKEVAQLEQTSRMGLVATGKLRSGQLSRVKTGTLLREKIRGIPTNLKLQVSLDPSLGNDLEVARTALQQINQVQVVTTDADCILGRMTPEVSRAIPRGLTMPTAKAVGLFLTGLKPITPTFSDPDESAQAAVERLQGRFKSLLAGKLLKLVTSSDAALVGQSSAYRVAVHVIPKGSRATATPKTFKDGTTIQIRVHNQESRNLYVAVIAITGSGRIIPIFPYWDSAESEAILAPDQTLLTPRDGDGFTFTLQGAGSLEVLVLASEKPIRDAMKGLQAIGASRSTTSRSLVSLSDDDELELVRSLLGDADRNARAELGVSRDMNAVNRRQLTAIPTMLAVE